jgi:hypothetical protein
MTDQRLHDLLHDSVLDADAPDLADLAWRAGVRARRRRALGAAAAVAAMAAAVGGTVWAVDQRPDPAVHQLQRPTTSESPYRPDASYHGVPVWWSPSLGQEAGLPAYPDNRLPATINLSQVGREISPVVPPPTRGLAAFALSGDHTDRVMSVGVLDTNGQVSLVDTVRVRPMRDPEGKLRVRVGASMLSPTGEYLMFPQQHSLLVLTLASGSWRTIHTGDLPTWDATWSSNTVIALPDPTNPTGPAPTYSVTGATSDTAYNLGQGVPDFSIGSSQAYGATRRASTGPTYVAQAFGAGARIPQPPALHLDPAQSDWISVGGRSSAILVLPMESGREKQCCQVATWLDPQTVVYESRSGDGLRLLAWRVGTHDFWNVATVTGWTPGQVSVVSSYADLSPSP